jgi:hypothetical protein
MSRFYQTSESPIVDYSFKLPYNEMKQFMQEKDLMQANQLQSLSLIDAELNKPVRDIDVQRNMQFRKQIEEQTSKLSEMDLTSSEGKREYTKLLSTVKKALSPGGEIEKQYANYAAEQENIKSIMENKDANPNLKPLYIQLLKSQSHSPATNSKSDASDFYGGEYSSFSPVSPAKHVDFFKEISAALNHIKADEYEDIKDSRSGGYITTLKQGRRGITKERVMEIAVNMIKQNPDIGIYYQDLLSLGVADPTQEIFKEVKTIDPKTKKELVNYKPNESNELGAAIKAAMDTYSFTETKTSKTSKEDSFALEDHKKQLEMDAKNVTVSVNSGMMTVNPGNPTAISNDYAGNINTISSEIKRIKAAGEWSGVKLPNGKTYFSQLNAAELTSTIQDMQAKGFDEKFPVLMQAAVNAQISLQKKEQFKKDIEILNADDIYNVLNSKRFYRGHVLDILTDENPHNVYSNFARTKTLTSDDANMLETFFKKSKYKNYSDLAKEKNKGAIIKEAILALTEGGHIDISNSSQGVAGKYLNELLKNTKGWNSTTTGSDLNKSKVVEFPITATQNPGFRIYDPATGTIVSDAKLNTETMKALESFDFSMIQLFEEPGGKTSTGKFKTAQGAKVKSPTMMETAPRNDGGLWGYVVDADNKKQWFRLKDVNVSIEKKLPTGGATTFVTNLQDHIASAPSYKIDNLVRAMAYNNMPNYSFNKPFGNESVKVDVNYKKAHANSEKIAKGQDLFYNSSDFVVRLNFSDGTSKQLVGPQAYNALLQYSEGVTLPSPQPIYDKNVVPTK